MVYWSVTMMRPFMMISNLKKITANTTKTESDLCRGKNGEETGWLTRAGGVP